MLVESSGQTHVIQPMRPTKPNRHLTLSHLPICSNIVGQIHPYFILHFKCVDILRFLLDSKFDSWNQVSYFPPFLNILPTIQIKKKPTTLFLLCIQSTHWNAHFYLQKPVQSMDRKLVTYTYFLKFFSCQSVGPILVSSSPFSPLSLLSHLHRSSQLWPLIIQTGTTVRVLFLLPFIYVI